jgi:hypothetical protein
MTSKVTTEQATNLLELQARSAEFYAIHDDSCVQCRITRIVSGVAQEILDAGCITEKSIHEWFDTCGKRLHEAGLTWLGTIYEQVIGIPEGPERSDPQ